MATPSIQNIAFKYGAITSLAYAAFFFLMQLLGLAHHYELRALNLLFLFGGVFLAMKKYRAAAGRPTYIKNLSIGVLTGAVSVLIFGAFIGLYVGAINPGFLEELQLDPVYGHYLNSYIVGVAIFLEGTLSSLLVAFILMQYWKTSHMDEDDDVVA